MRASNRSSWIGHGRWVVMVAAVTMLRCAGPGEGVEPGPSSEAAPAAGPETPAASGANVEVRRGALTSLSRGYMQAILANNRIMLVWTDNIDPATGAPGALQRPWVAILDPANGGQVVGAQTYATRPSYKVVQSAARAQLRA